MKNIRACSIFLFIYFVLNFVAPIMKKTGLTCILTSLKPGAPKMLMQWCVSKRIKTQKVILILKNVRNETIVAFGCCYNWSEWLTR